MNEAATVQEARSLLTHSQRVCRLFREAADGRSGESFNLFRILGVERLEVSTHSAILRELLDPRGSHGQGAVFLRRFVEVLELPAFDYEQGRVDAEYGIGSVTETSGGRLDLRISDGTGPRIIIENKIDAGEQADWVTRYLDHAPSATLVFLTLRGNEPSNIPTSGRPKRLECIAYQSQILDWLLECRKEAAMAPIVRESLSQYIALVRKLTQQNPESPMNAELVKAATQSVEALDAYFALRNVERDVRKEMIGRFQMALAEEAQCRGLVFEGEPDCDYSGKYAAFDFSGDQLRQLGLLIRFEFDRSNYQGFCHGLVDEGKLPPEQRAKLGELFATRFSKPSTSQTWPAYVEWTPPSGNWNDGSAFVAMQTGALVRDVMAVVDAQLEVVKAFSHTKVPPQTEF
jgi:hypothetical protein